jgi:ribosome-binding protein aMBF1 (putative translation factor)
MKTRMKDERLKRGWSQVVLAFHTNIGVADISRIESGRMVPYPAQAERLAKVLGIQPEELQQTV